MLAHTTQEMLIIVTVKCKVFFSGTEVGFHYIDQNQFKLTEATAINAKKGDVVIFSYLLVHGSYINK